MNQPDERNKLTIENIDCILRLREEEWIREKDVMVFFRERYRESVHNFRNKIFGAAAALATLLTAILAFKDLQQYEIIIIVVLGIDLIIVGLAEILFSKHNNKAAYLFFVLDSEYLSAITHINNQRIFVAGIVPRIEDESNDKLNILPFYTEVSLSQFRLGIISQIKEISKHIRYLNYIRQSLAYLSDKQNNLLQKAYEIYLLKRGEFERENEILSGLTLNETPLLKWKNSNI